MSRDLAEGERRRNEGMGAVQFDKEAYIAEAMVGMRTLCRERLVFSPDDVHEYIPELPPDAHPSIISTILSKATTKDFKYCRRLDISTKSERPERHASRVFWYASNLARYMCRTCNQTGMIHAVDHEEGVIYTEFCTCPLGEDPTYRKLICDHYEGKNV